MLRGEDPLVSRPHKNADNNLEIDNLCYQSLRKIFQTTKNNDILPLTSCPLKLVFSLQSQHKILLFASDSTSITQRPKVTSNEKIYLLTY